MKFTTYIYEANYYYLICPEKYREILKISSNSSSSGDKIYEPSNNVMTKSLMPSYDSRISDISKIGICLAYHVSTKQNLKLCYFRCMPYLHLLKYKSNRSKDLKRFCI